MQIDDGEPREVTVILGVDFDAEEGTVITVADYAKRTLHEVGPDGVNRSSLLALWSFRFFEYHNRLHLGRVVDAGQPTEWHAFVPALSRHALSQLDSAANLNELTWENGEASFDERTVFKAVADRIELPVAVRGQLVRYLRRTLCGHPGIYVGAFADRVPRCFELQFWQGFRTIRVEILEDLGPTARPMLNLPVTKPTDLLQECIDEARATGPISAVDEEQAMERLKGLVDAELWVQAFLSIMEWSWCRTPLPEKMQNVVNTIMTLDPRNQRLMDVLQGKTDLDEDAKAAEVYALRPAAAGLGHCIDVFVGSMRMYDDPEMGEAALLRALSQNPRMAGPYHDLGLIHANAYQYREAYRCWEMARWLSPGFGMMSDVDAREADVLGAEQRIPLGSMVLAGPEA